MSVDSAVLFARSALLIVCIAAVFISCSSAALRRGEGAAGAGVRILITLIGPASVLAFVGLFYWPLALAASLVAAAWQGANSTSYLWTRLGEVWSSTSLVSKAALITLAVACAFRAGAALSTPPTEGDSLLYHLPMSAALIQDHTMWFTRALLYPGASELGEALGAASTGTVTGIVAFQLTEILALALVAFGWARRAGASIDGATAAAIVAVALPIVVDQMFTSQNDIVACVTVAAACVLWRPSPRLAAISLGLAAAAKVTAFVLIPAVAIVMIAFEGWPFSVTDVAWAVAISAPWYIRTWFLTGSPLYTVASLGWSSTIAANLAHAWRFVLAALRTYGGLGAVAGIAALAFLVGSRMRTTFARALPWLALASFVAWIVLPDSAESVRGTLDQIRQGWSLRYVILLPFVLATALPVVLDRVPVVPVAAFVALIAAASAVVRSANLSASNEPLGFVYAIPILLALLLVIIGLAARVRASTRTHSASAFIAAGLALVILSLIVVAGTQSVTRLWEAAYLQWSLRIPTSSVGLDTSIASSSKAAVVGMRSFPLVGPTFARRTYDNIIIESPSAWLAELRRSGVPVLAAAGESGAPDQPGFLQPLPVESWISHDIARDAAICKISTHGYVRIYGLTRDECARALRPAQQRRGRTN